MAKSYEEIQQEIITTLVGRPVGTQIQPENHQQFALDMLEFANAMGSLVSNGLMGEALANTDPIEPSDANVAYVFQVPADTTKTFANFLNSNSNPISVTTNSSQAAIGFLMWNQEYWSAITVYVAVSSPSFVYVD